MMGICGTAMASLAGLLKDKGFHVTGSDSHPYPPMSTQIESLGIKIQKPYSADNLKPQPDFVIVGNVISASNPEAMEVVRLHIPHCSLPQAMGEFIIADRKSFVVSGTHGKTTTTSMVSWILDQAGLQPGFLIGGIPKNFDKSFRNPAQNTFVIEGDEYDTAYFDKVPKFIHYKPQQVILTSVEFDHADIYKDLDHVKSAFNMLMKLIPETGNFVFWGDDANVNDVAKNCSIKNKFSFGFNAENYFKIEIISETEISSKFKILKQGELLVECEILQIGKYNILNAAAAALITYLNNVPLDKMTQALKTFKGVKRRQEILGEFGGVTLIEDFAHHPTAVKQTIEAVQNKYKNRKVFSIFEPRSATSRRKVFQKDYYSAFKAAQESIIAEAFDQSKLDTNDKFSTEELVQSLTSEGYRSQVLPSADRIVEYIGKTAKPTDIVLIMSNGGFDGIYDKLIAKLKV
jgi:UDP-N-acetylmuramate: L-alanyl-gamma-D-glutamyl-meso-diaminopimelate ligase